MKLSAIILALTTTKELYNMTNDCINSLIESEKDLDIEIIVVESNKSYLNSEYIYPDFVKVIIPDTDFNFHKFLNIGIKSSKGEYIALCNNDLIFYKDWFYKIMQVKKQNPTIKSFSPSNKINDCTITKSFELGYKVRTHVMGWCLVADRTLFSKIGFLDETFDFSFADNDYAMTLKKYNIKHALVCDSKVEHLDKKVSIKIKGDYVENLKFNKNIDIKLPDYLFSKDFEWVFSDEKGLRDFLKYHKKWGSPNILYKKNRIADILIKLKLGVLNRIVFFGSIIN